MSNWACKVRAFIILGSILVAKRFMEGEAIDLLKVREAKLFRRKSICLRRDRSSCAIAFGRLNL